MYSTISREEIEDNKYSQDITKSVNVNIDDAEKTSLSDETLTDRYFYFQIRVVKAYAEFRVMYKRFCFWVWVKK